MPQDQREMAASGNQIVIQHRMAVCADCNSNLVEPITWKERKPNHWDVILRCPNCEWTNEFRGQRIFEQWVVEKFDRELDAGMESLKEGLVRITHANMSEEIELFTTALHADAILPEDF